MTESKSLKGYPEQCYVTKFQNLGKIGAPILLGGSVD